MDDQQTESLRQKFEALANDSFDFKRSGRGTYVNPAVARDWKWFQEGAKRWAEVPAGWRPVMVEEGKAPAEPDWDEVMRQAETTTGLKVERNTYSIVIREVRRWLTQRESQPEVARWEYRWTNPSNDPGRERDAEWKEVVSRWNQTMEQACRELEGYRHDGKPCYEVRALYAHPPAASIPAMPSVPLGFVYYDDVKNLIGKDWSWSSFAVSRVPKDGGKSVPIFAGSLPAEAPKPSVTTRRVKPYNQIEEQCRQEGLHFIAYGDDKYRVTGGGCHVVVNISDSCFRGCTPNGVHFSSSGDEYSSEPWFRALEDFFLEKPSSTSAEPKVLKELKFEGAAR